METAVQDGDDKAPGVAGDGQVATKLLQAKRAWARDGRLLTGTKADPAVDRLPPGQRLVQDWPVLDLGAVPPGYRRRGAPPAQPAPG